MGTVTENKLQGRESPLKHLIIQGVALNSNETALCAHVCVRVCFHMYNVHTEQTDVSSQAQAG